MQNSLLSIENLTVKFGGLTALDNFNLQITAGAPYGLIGPNGAGKTTVFNLVTGVYQPTQGKIFVGGKNVVGLEANEIARSGIARTFQNIRLFVGMTVFENLIAAASIEREGTTLSSIFGFKKARNLEHQVYERALNLLDFVGLKRIMNEPAKSLCYGDQRKLEIARALMLRPKLLLLDEPAAGMNPTEKASLRQIVSQISQQGVGVLLIEHDMHFVMNLCHEITVLDYGQVIARGTPEEVQGNKRVIEAYLGVDMEPVHA